MGLAEKSKPNYKDRGAELKQRTRQFALAVIKLYGDLPKTTVAQVIGKQFLRSGTSVGAHYHEATRARSSAEFVSKIDGGLQELEETVYWLLLLIEARIMTTKRVKPLHQEALELNAILTASSKSAKRSK